MRAIGMGVLSVLLGACASTVGYEPREYLDAQTAATISVAASPWTFARDRPEVAAHLRDYLSLYAFEVNRSGRRATFLIAHAWSTVNGEEAIPESAPALAIAADDRLIVLSAATEPMRALGVGEPIAPLRARSERAWCYPIEREALAHVVGAQRLSIEIRRPDGLLAYEPWRDARAAYAEFLERTGAKRF